MRLWMAPLHGLTNHVFRNIWLQHFVGIDQVITPFISLNNSNIIKPILLNDFLPENNPHILPVPQIIGNKANELIVMANELKQLGYRRININLGCPSGQVVKHRRGSGLLRYPETLKSFLDAIPQLPEIQFSVKMRIGYKSNEELMPIINILNQYPLEFVCIHPRLGIQQYAGNLHLADFERAQSALHHPIIFNGDIQTQAQFISLTKKYPSISEWMIGRQLITNPFFPGQITNAYPDIPKFYAEKFSSFHQHLMNKLLIHYANENTALNKAKEYWKYFAANYPSNPEELRFIYRIDNWNEFIYTVQTLIPSLQFNNHNNNSELDKE